MQDVIRVNRDQVGNLFHEWQAVVGIIVEPALVEAAEIQAHRLQPGYDARDIAGLKCGDASRFVGEVAVFL